MYTINWRNKFFDFSLFVLAFIIPFPFICATIAIWLMVLAWIIQGDFKTKLKYFVKPTYLLWILYFLLFAISYFYSDNKTASLKDLERKLSFVILPLVVATGISINKKNLEYLFLSFILGISTVAIYCIVNASYQYGITHNKSFFFYHTLVSNFDANAVYMSFYTLFAVFLLLFFKWSIFFQNKKSIFRWLLFGLIFTFLILLSCRLLIAIFFLLLLAYAVKLLFQPGKELLIKKAVLIITVLIIGCLIAFTNNPVSKRYKDLKSNNIGMVFEKDYKTKTFRVDYLTVRPFIWRICLQNIVEKNLWWTGCGNGDIYDLQNQKMADLGVEELRNENRQKSPLYSIAIHNMYLQSLMMIGISGLIVLTMIVFVPFLFLKRIDYKFIFLAFHISAAMFMMQESVLQTQAGIVYYVLFSVIYWNFYYSLRNIKHSAATLRT